jgi:tetratricopeptide (TPR) repeat protein
VVATWKLNRRAENAGGARSGRDIRSLAATESDLMSLVQQTASTFRESTMRDPRRREPSVSSRQLRPEEDAMAAAANAMGRAVTSLEALKAYSLGVAERTRGAEAESIRFFKRAIELDPNFALAHARLGVVYQNLGQTAPGREYMTKAFELRDRVSEREKFYIMGHYYSGVMEDVGKTQDTYELWKKTYPRDSIPYGNLAVLHFQTGQIEKSLQETLIEFQLSPSESLSYYHMASVYMALGRFDEATQAILTGLQIYPKYAENPINRREFYNNPSEFDRQLRNLENYVSTHPSNLNARFLLGYNYFFTQAYEKAEEQLKAVLSSESLHSSAQYLSGLIQPVQIDVIDPAVAVFVEQRERRAGLRHAGVG